MNHETKEDNSYPALKRFCDPKLSKTLQPSLYLDFSFSQLPTESNRQRPANPF